MIPNETLVAAAMAYIQAHLSRIHSPQEVADALGCSYETLRKVFSRERGITLGRYLEVCRIEEMKRLLGESDLQIKQICYELGLREDSAAHLFRRVTGMTMQAWRAAHRHQP
jgi:two-component system response regulator YesN